MAAAPTIQSAPPIQRETDRVHALFQWNKSETRGRQFSRFTAPIVAGGRDTLIPGARTQGLRLAAGNLAFDETIAEAGHNDIYRHPRFVGATRDALAALRRRD